jgi:hypothetical protein
VNDRHFYAPDWLHANEDQQATYPGIAELLTDAAENANW